MTVAHPHRPGLALHRKHWRAELRRVRRRTPRSPRIIEANPASSLGVEMPHARPRPGGRGTDVRAVPARRCRTARRGSRRPGASPRSSDVVVAYRISGGEEPCLRRVLPGRHRRDLRHRGRARPGHPQRGRLHREGQRADRAQPSAWATSLSPVLLLQSSRGEELHAASRPHRRSGRAGRDGRRRGRPRARDLGRSAADAAARPLTALAGAATSSSPTATTAARPRRSAGSSRFLAVITTPQSVAIRPYNRPA